MRARRAPLLGLLLCCACGDAFGTGAPAGGAGGAASASSSSGVGGSEPSTSGATAGGGGTAGAGGAGVGGGGVGGSGAAPWMTFDCGAGKISDLVDPFDSLDLTTRWEQLPVSTATPGTAAAVGGVLQFSVPKNTAPAFVGIRSVGYFDLTDCAFTIELINDPSAQMGDELKVALRGDASNWVAFFTPSDVLQTTALVAGNISNQDHAYDPSEHRFLRIRVSGGTLFWEGSPDGKTFNELRQRTAPPFLNSVYLELSRFVGNASDTPGAALFDHVNLLPP
jgi:hypothetical protein